MQWKSKSSFSWISSPGLAKVSLTSGVLPLRGAGRRRQAYGAGEGRGETDDESGGCGGGGGGGSGGGGVGGGRGGGG